MQPFWRVSLYSGRYKTLDLLLSQNGRIQEWVIISPSRH
jgi:hypothetical protein